MRIRRYSPLVHFILRKVVVGLVLKHQDPTHRVTHVDGWVAAIYIADSLQQKLESHNVLVRKGARDSVSIRFREACRANHRRFNLVFIDWRDLRVEKLQMAAMATFVGHPSELPSHMPTVEDDILDPMFNGNPCDDCPSCDQGYHERCRNDCSQGGW